MTTDHYQKQVDEIWTILIRTVQIQEETKLMFQESDRKFQMMSQESDRKFQMMSQETDKKINKLFIQKNYFKKWRMASTAS